MCSPASEQFLPGRHPSIKIARSAVPNIPARPKASQNNANSASFNTRARLVDLVTIDPLARVHGDAAEFLLDGPGEDRTGRGQDLICENRSLYALDQLLNVVAPNVRGLHRAQCRQAHTLRPICRALRPTLMARLRPFLDVTISQFRERALRFPRPAFSLRILTLGNLIRMSCANLRAFARPMRRASPR